MDPEDGGDPPRLPAEAVFNIGFGDVDAAGQPAALVSHQDRFNAQVAAQAYKQQTHALLGLQAGDRVLDVGCGSGDDVRALARIVGPTGKVVGIDLSETMVAQARVRSEGLALPVEFRTGDIHALDFADGEFAAARADRVLHHLDDPDRALRELARVVKPGGMVVVSDPDFDTFVIDHPDRELTRCILDVFATGGARSGGLGRHLYALFVEQGFLDVAVLPIPVLLTDLGLAEDVMWIRPTLERARTAGAVSAGEAAAWMADLEDAHRDGRFFAAGFGFMVGGRKPPTS